MTIANHFLLASNGVNPWDVPPFTQPALIVGAGLIGLMLTGITVLHFVDLWQKVMGKRTPIALDLGTHEAPGSPGKLAVDITGFVATKEFEAHKEEVRLRATGLEKQISDLRHEWTNDLQGYVSAAEEHVAKTQEAITAMHEKSSENGERLASVETKSDLILAMLTNLDNKVFQSNSGRRNHPGN